MIEPTLRSKLDDATHWSICSMAGVTGFSHRTIRRIWTAFGLQPHRSETFKLSSDPLFVDKVRDIVGLYLSPLNRALLLSVNEKSQAQALDREQPVLPMMPRMPERRTDSYVRHGTTSLFADLLFTLGGVLAATDRRTVDLIVALVSLCHSFKQPIPYAQLSTAHEAVVAGRRRTIALRYIRPRGDPVRKRY